MTATATIERHATHGHQTPKGQSGANGQDDVNGQHGEKDNYDPQSSIEIDEAFRALAPPLSPSESTSLHDLLRVEGCLHSLLVWEEQKILLDGHHRIDYCRPNRIPFPVRFISLPDRAAAEAYIRKLQHARRNISNECASYLRGQHYLAVMQSFGGYREKNEARSQNDTLRTALIVGDIYNKSASTIHRDRKFAVAIDSITANCGEHVKNVILGREGGLRRSAVLRVAKMETAAQKQYIEDFIKNGKAPRRSAKNNQSESITLPRKVETLVDKLFQRLNEDERDFLLKRFAELIEDSKRTGFCHET